MKKIMAICGSVRKSSSNHFLIYAVRNLYKESVEISVFERLSDIPAFNPDTKEEELPSVVSDFKKKIRSADGVLICTPEYAHGIPGSLKNAIDWTVGSGEFSQKPVALITASTDGRFAHAAMLEVLKVIEAAGTDQFHLLIPFIQTKVSLENIITDAVTLTAVKKLMDQFIMFKANNLLQP